MFLKEIKAFELAFFPMVNDFVILKGLSRRKLLESCPVCALARTAVLCYKLASPTVYLLDVKGRNKLSLHSKGTTFQFMWCVTLTSCT